ncbi:2-hydroxychromene-2-carboxylate isomerase [Neptuniibacter halophilus]|uniref:2-hydroxychromene-2-carboxylate isomerase n=1 Tax=Neptuniibacter halophilus TaxID=651666 RepID=UPI0025727465|nr:2-hydroxychromene-2-carboxylate isomerase [Neptuniibacter halophilus]
MNRQIDYYCTSLSPFTYLGHTRLLELAGSFHARILYKPVIVPQIFAESGALPLKERPKARQNYRLLEIGRWARKRGLPVHLHPAYFPVDPSLADKCVIALQLAGEDAGAFLGRALAACWAEQKNIADPEVIRALLDALNMESEEILLQADSSEVDAVYRENTQDAIAKEVLGVPAYVLDGEQFWGQDRLELLADTLQSLHTQAD